MSEIIIGNQRSDLEPGLAINVSLSAKLVEGSDPDFYEKVMGLKLIDGAITGIAAVTMSEWFRSRGG